MEYSITNFNEVSDELFNNWYKINPRYIFPTPAEHGIHGYSLVDDFDIYFPHTKRVIDELRSGDKTYHLRLFIYPPKTRTTFHKDIPEFRYVIPIVSNEMCLNYEINDNVTNQEELTSLFFKIKTKEELENFNNEFTNKGNRIYRMCDNHSNLIGTNSHAHINFGDTDRIVLVYDYKNKLI